MSGKDSAKILKSLDVLSVQVGHLMVKTDAIDANLEAFQSETRANFGRVERRLGYLETRFEGLETEFRAFRIGTERRITALEATD